MPDPSDNDFLNIDEAAALTGYTVSTLRTYVSLEKIPFHQRMPGASLRFRRAELEAWLRGERPDTAA
jgi:excisionase family DNA binding protein